jgi:AI-2 transport protein TqsA
MLRRSPGSKAQGIAAAGVLVGAVRRALAGAHGAGVLAQLQGIVSFTVVAVVFVILGLLEVGRRQRSSPRCGRSRPRSAAGRAAASAAKLRAYMLVRTLASVLTGVLVYAFARFMGLDLAAEWGVIAFVLNYIPFLGPLVATCSRRWSGCCSSGPGRRW